MAGTILIIDDSWIARLRITQYLNDGGYHVIEADSGEKGLERIEQDKPDLVLLDLLMPGLSGFEILSTIRESGNDIPVIIMTADIQHTTREKCLELGAAMVLPKPPAKDVLLSGIDDIVGKS